jgi:serine protease AprX
MPMKSHVEAIPQQHTRTLSVPRSAAPAAPQPSPAPAASRPSPNGPPRREAPKPWQAGVALVVASAIMLAAGFGVGSLFQGLRDTRSSPSAPEAGTAQASEPYTLYITDAVGNLSALDVKVGGVFVGPDQTPMALLNPAFDLASLHGPGGAIPLATAAIPPDQRAPVIVIFESAQATIDGVRTAVPDLAPLVLSGSSALASQDGAMLMDVDLMASLTERNGTLAFQPTLQAVYTADPAQVTDPDSWGLPLPPPPTGALVALGSGLASKAAMNSAQTLEKDLAQPPMDQSLSADSNTGHGWMVQFHDVGITREQMITVLNATGAVFLHALVSLPAAYVLATDDQAELLASNSNVEHVEREESVTYSDAESHQAVRLAQVANPVTGLHDANGRPIRGTGIGVAVVDSGVDATHADLPYRPLVPGGAVGANYKVVSQAAVPMPNSDSTSGHGTHVASIIAGRGTSDPTQAGVAPGATIYGLGIGESSTTVWASQAFDWILANGQALDPPIKVVTNSWGSGTTYDPNSVLSRLTERMVDRGIVVVYAAGNSAGDGTTAQTSAQCQIPRAGVICVGAFDDLGTGTRDGKVASFTSRGATASPSTWPDLSAPGVGVRGARPLVGAQTGVAVSPYAEMSGTSQAAPHVAGIVALMLQADGSLTPAQVDVLLKLTAYKYADGGAYSTSTDPAAYRSHNAKGHGLADAYAAVVAALA